MGIKLPTKKEPPIADSSSISLLIYSDYGLGKTTFCAEAPEVLIIAPEPGLNAVAGYKHEVKDWDEMRETYHALAQRPEQYPYKTIAIDTLDVAFKMCQDWVCKKHGVEHETDIPGFAKGYTLINNEFYKIINGLLNLPFGLFLTAHPREVTIKTRTSEYVKWVPDLPDKIRGRIIGLVDFVLRGSTREHKDTDGVIEVEHILYTKPHDRWIAKDRFGVLPDVLPFSYIEFNAAFRSGMNQGHETTKKTDKTEKNEKGGKINNV